MRDNCLKEVTKEVDLECLSVSTEQNLIEFQMNRVEHGTSEKWHR